MNIYKKNIKPAYEIPNKKWPFIYTINWVSIIWCKLPDWSVVEWISGQIDNTKKHIIKALSCPARDRNSTKCNKTQEECPAANIPVF